MKKYFFLICFNFFIFNFSIAYSQSPEPGEISEPNSEDGPLDDSGVSNGDLSPNYFSGALNYNFDIKVPSGRQGMTPKIWLRYNHHNKNQISELGSGWELNHSYFTRSIAKGVAESNGQDFVYHDEGVSRQLINTGIEVEGCVKYRLKYPYPNSPVILRCGSNWEVHERSGNSRYYNEILRGSAFNRGLYDFKWYMSRIQDPNGNYISYDYEDLNFNPDDANGVGPNRTYEKRLIRINYTNHERLEEGYFNILFNYQDRESFDFKLNYLLYTSQSKLLSSIRVENSDEEIVREYLFRYEFSEDIPFLVSIRKIAGEGDRRSELPSTSFSYEEFDLDRVWTQELSFSDPLGRPHRYRSDYRLLDMNGDTLVDRVFVDFRANMIRVHYNQGDQFNPEAEVYQDICTDICSGDDDLHFVDMNGDGLLDRVREGFMVRNLDGENEFYQELYVKYNSGNGFSYRTRWIDPFCLEEHQPQGARDQNYCLDFFVLDLNGDGLPDRTNLNNNRLGQIKIFFNQGQSFSSDAQQWFIPQDEDGEIKQIIDINGDHLPDVIYSGGDLDQTLSRVYFNHGNGWALEGFDWNDPGSHFDQDDTRLVDFNGDGKIDRIISRLGRFEIYLNQGNGFGQIPIIQAEPSEFGQARLTSGELPAFIDFNGDGFVDRILEGADENYLVFLNDYKQENFVHIPYLLKEVHNGLGVRSEFKYKLASDFENRTLPFPLYVLSQIESKEGNQSYFTNIQYVGGQFYGSWFNPVARRFNGFGFVQVRDDLDNIDQYWYHQSYDHGFGKLIYVDEFMPSLNVNQSIPIQLADDERIQDGEFESYYWGNSAYSGRVFKKIRYAKNYLNNNYFLKEKNEYDWSHIFDFYYLREIKKSDYEENTGARISRKRFTYNDQTILTRQEVEVDPLYNEPIRVIEYDDFKLIGRRNFFFSSYVHQIRREFSDNVIRNSESFNYDDDFNLLSRNTLVRYDDPQGNAEVDNYISQYEPDVFGNTSSYTNARGVTTRYTYDQRTKTYPTLIVIDNNYPETRVYDLNYGKWISKTDISGRVYEKEYDAWGRLIEDQFQGRWFKRIHYIDSQIRDEERFISGMRVYKNISSDPFSGILPNEVVYQDGRGRVFQTFIRSERSDLNYRMSHTGYFKSRDRNYVYKGETVFVDNSNFAERGFVNHTTIFKDSLNRELEIDFPDGDENSPIGDIEISYGFENNPYVISKTDPGGRVKREFYNPWGNISEIREYLDGQEIRTRYGYDYWNNLILIVDPLRHNYEFAYDNLGRKRYENRPGVGVKTYNYDERNNFIESIDGNQNRIQNSYDNLDRLALSVSINSDEEIQDQYRYIYDVASNSNGENFEEEYAIRRGELFSVEDGQGYTRLSYDDYGHEVKRARYTEGFDEEMILLTSKNPEGKPVNLIYPFNQVELNYNYDSNGNILNITKDNSTIYGRDNDDGYDNLGNLLLERFGDGNRNAYEYYPRSHRLKEHKVRNFFSREILKQDQYSYDENHNLVRLDNLLNSSQMNSSIQDIEYDDLDRLVSYTYNNEREGELTTRYRYDRLGNILEVSGEINQRYNYNDQLQLVSLSGENFSYDDHGNLISGRGRSYQYNSRNQLEEVSMQNGFSIRFGYDYSGSRVKKIIESSDGRKDYYYLGKLFEMREGKLVHNIYAGSKLIAVKLMDFQNNQDDNEAIFLGWIKNNYQYLIQIIVVYFILFYLLKFFTFIKLSSSYRIHLYYQIISLVLCVAFILPYNVRAFEFRPDVDDDWPEKSDDYFYYVHGDFLGSSNLHTEGEEKATHDGKRYRKGEVVQRIEYAPFGFERLVLNSTEKEQPKFTGQTQDLETDLHYYNARYYDSVIGRFIQPDSIIPDVYSSQGLNSYAYVYNNPFKYTDPGGNNPILLGIAAGIFIPVGFALVITSNLALSAYMRGDMDEFDKLLEFNDFLIGASIDVFEIVSTLGFAKIPKVISLLGNVSKYNDRVREKYHDDEDYFHDNEKERAYKKIRTQLMAEGFTSDEAEAIVENMKSEIDYTDRSDFNRVESHEVDSHDRKEVDSDPDDLKNKLERERERRFPHSDDDYDDGGYDCIKTQMC